MITKAEIDRLNPGEKLEVMQILWESFVADPDSLPVTEQEKKEIQKRSRAHHSDPGSSLSEAEFTERLEKRFGRPE